MKSDEFPDNNSEVPIESADDFVLHMLGGAHFGPNASLQLPSGAMLSSAEAQAFTAAYKGQSSETQQAVDPEQDDRLLQSLGGATFGPNAELVMPTGTRLPADEAQAFSAALKGLDLTTDQEDRRNRPASDPLDSRHDNWTKNQGENRKNLVSRLLQVIGIKT